MSKRYVKNVSYVSILDFVLFGPCHKIYINTSIIYLYAKQNARYEEVHIFPITSCFSFANDEAYWIISLRLSITPWEWNDDKWEIFFIPAERIFNIWLRRHYSVSSFVEHSTITVSIFLRARVCWYVLKCHMTSYHLHTTQLVVSIYNLSLFLENFEK